MSSKGIKNLVDKLDDEIMEWYYDCVKINFGVDMIQNSTDLRNILEENLIDIQKDTRKLIAEEMAIAQKEGQPTSRLTSLYNKINKLYD